MHIVVFKWKDGVSVDHVIALRAALSELPERIPELLSYEHGPDLGLFAGNGDFVIKALVASPEDLDRYLTHPSHRALVRRHAAPLLADRMAVQIAVE
jgi:hypothetical protein